MSKFLAMLVFLVSLVGCANDVGVGDPYAQGWQLSKLYRFTEAENAFRRAVTLRETRFGPESVQTAYALRALAGSLQQQGRYAEAEQLATRALAVMEKQGRDYPGVADALSTLAIIYFRQDKFVEGLTTGMRAIEVANKSYDYSDDGKAGIYTMLGANSKMLSRHSEAEKYFSKVLAIAQKSSDKLFLENALSNLAWTHVAQGRHEEAQKLLQQCLTLLDEAGGPNNPDIPGEIATLAISLDAQGRTQEALSTIRRADQAQRLRLYEDAGLGRATSQERITRRVMPNVVRIGWRAVNEVPAERSAVIRETFEAAQIVRSAETGSTLSRVAARFAADDDPLGQAIRTQQDLNNRSREVELALAESGGLGGKGSTLRAELASLTARTGELRRDLASRFPISMLW